METNRTQGFAVTSLISDIYALERWEHWLQLSYSTADLHIIRAWEFKDELQSSDEFLRNAQALDGNIIYSLLDINRLKPPQLCEKLVECDFGELQWREQIFPFCRLNPPSGYHGNPTGKYWIIICQVSLGRTFTYTNTSSNEDSFLEAIIPDGYQTIVRHSFSDSSHRSFQQLYRVKSNEQVLPYILVEFEFKPLRLEVNIPICEMCEGSGATKYCPSDRVHLCEACDESHHSASNIVARHKRVPVSESPFQFSNCPSHPLEKLDSVCMTCFLALCPHCILFGHHSNIDSSQHYLVSTLDAYRMAMKKSSPSEEALNHRKDELSKAINLRHKQLVEVYSNFLAIQRRLSNAAKNVMKNLDSLKVQKIGYLQGLKRQFLIEILIIEWIEAFFAHLKLALCPSEFLFYKNSHDLLALHYYSGKIRFEVEKSEIPKWVLDGLILEGSFRPIKKSTYIPDLTFPAEVSQDFTSLLSNTGDKSIENIKAKWKNYKTFDKQLTGPNKQTLTQTNVSLIPKFEEISYKAAVGLNKSERNTNEGNIVYSRPVGGRKSLLEQPYEHSPDNVDAVISKKEFSQENHSLTKDVGEGEYPIQSISLQKKKAMVDDGGKRSGKSKLSKALWRYLSEFEYHLVSKLLKVCRVTERTYFLKTLFHLANYFGAFENLTSHLLKIELFWLSSVPEPLVTAASSLINPLFHAIFLNNEFLLPVDTLFLHQLIQPLLYTIEDSDTPESETPTADISERNSACQYRVVLENFVDNVTSLLPQDFPPTILSFIYAVNAAVNNQIFKQLDVACSFGGSLKEVYANLVTQQTHSSAAVSACCQTLLVLMVGNFLLGKYQRGAQKKEPRKEKDMLLSNTEHSLDAEDNSVPEPTPPSSTYSTTQQQKSWQMVKQFELFLRQIVAATWDISLRNSEQSGNFDETDGTKLYDDHNNDHKEWIDNETELLQILATKVKRWMQGIISRPYLKCTMKFRTNNLFRSGELAAINIADFALRLDEEIKRGDHRRFTLIDFRELYMTKNFEEMLRLAVEELYNTSSRFLA